MVKKWAGTVQKTCDICGKQLSGTFIDGKTHGGRWAIMCKTCHRDYGKGLGLGLGQEYNLETKEKIGG